MLDLNHNINETPKEKLTRDKIYKNESQIETVLDDFYNPTMSHRMKEKDTFKAVFPTSELWGPEIIFKTTNEVLKPSSFKDPYHDETHYFKSDWNKKYAEEMLKAKNMMIKKKKDVGGGIEKKPSKGA
jgi:hypothetical protein